MPSRCLVVLCLLIAAPVALADDTAATAALGARLEPFLSALGGRDARFELCLTFTGEIDKKKQSATITISRLEQACFVFAVEHQEYSFRIERLAEQTTLVVPGHKVAFRGTGPIQGSDTLEPKGLATRLFSQDSAVFPFANVLTGSTGPLAARLLTGLAGLKSDDGRVWTASSLGDAKITFDADSKAMEITAGGAVLKLSRLDLATTPATTTATKSAEALPADFKITTVDRTELERVLVRAPRRALEVVAPGPQLANPSREPRQVPHGELRWVDGMRLGLFWGTPGEIGTAHGKLLAQETRRCLESTVYLVGGVDSIARGRWFPDELRGAYRRLEKFIPEDHKIEMDALADAAGLGREDMRLANVFPELFHCSGFAVFGKATADGKLYHGRVLDYMTLIGLQDSATVMVEAVAGKIPFANVGYAGFVGSVSGMNAQQISLGEMGGRGEGNWDGVPMATLMRRALEECSTLDAVKKLWSESPRTCEYYYIFADGKIPSAVGVAATPEQIQFVAPGEGHPLLGDGIPDTVVLSAGDRLKTLRERVTSSHGKIDVEKALWLMSRPVAMNSNLHNALFVPQDLVFHVAHADRHEIAARRPYTRFDLGALVAEITRETAAVRPPTSPAQ